jgi:hypothetical protein
MIIRGTPTNLNEYIKVKKGIAKLLHRIGLIPTYIDSEYVYFRKDNFINGKHQRTNN